MIQHLTNQVVKVRHTDFCVGIKEVEAIHSTLHGLCGCVGRALERGKCKDTETRRIHFTDFQ